MLNEIAPFGLSEMLRSLAQAAPNSWHDVTFVAILGLYWYFLSKLAVALLSRADFAIATNFRRMRLSPPAIQFWIGDFCERLPKRVAVLGVLGLALTMFWAGPLRHASLDPVSALGKFRDGWSLVLQWLWRS